MTETATETETATATVNVTTAAKVAGSVRMGDGFGGVLSPTIFLVGPMSALDYGPLKLISVDFFSPHLYFNFWLEKKNSILGHKK